MIARSLRWARRPSTWGAIAQRVHDRALRFLRRRGYLEARPAEERGNDTPALSALSACIAADDDEGREPSTAAGKT